MALTCLHFNERISVQIRSLIIQPELWRFAGFVSSLVGLLCYALSSSFKHLFGEWNYFKIVLYIVASFIICFIILFATKWQLSSSLLLKAHVGFLVLMLTSWYSFFYDKAMNGKPDILSLISWGAFALMSFSLSRQIDLGFEADLFNFFLGYLTLQLMKINLMLCFVGAFFCYSLIMLRFRLDSQQVTQTTSVAVTEHVAIEIEAANDRKKELFTILGIMKGADEGVIFPSDLDAKLRHAITAGSVKECSQVYCIWRRQFLDEKLLHVGFQKLDIKEIHKRPLNYLKYKIEQWMEASKYVARKLFPNERELCNRVFFGFPPYADFCFMEVCWGPTIQLLNFANGVATGDGSPERLFSILDVLKTLTDILPDLESLFSDQCLVVVRNEAITIWERMAEGIRGAFMELEELISLDPAKIAVPGGGVHPINYYIMNFLCVACESWQTQSLDQIFQDNELRLREFQKSKDRLSSSTSLSVNVARIMEKLESSLEAKSKIYKDSALSSVFMMNNSTYIVHKAKDNELGKLLGEGWIQKHTANVYKYFTVINRTSWNLVIDMLSLDNGLTPDVAVESLREKLDLFVSQFEDMCEVQSAWVIFDDQLREKIRSHLKKTLLPSRLTFENLFMTRFQDGVETCKHTDMYQHFVHIVSGINSKRFRDGIEARRHTDTYQDFWFQHIVSGINRLFQGRDELKNRKNIQPTWTVVSPITKDFREWKRYGQKTIINSAYSRNYYCCIYKFNQGCQATKQVQQTQENPQMFQTRYIGFHTCKTIPSTTYHY